jgi:hypothetical protein
LLYCTHCHSDSFGHFTAGRTSGTWSPAFSSNLTLLTLLAASVNSLPMKKPMFYLYMSLPHFSIPT